MTTEEFNKSVQREIRRLIKETEEKQVFPATAHELVLKANDAVFAKEAASLFSKENDERFERPPLTKEGTLAFFDFVQDAAEEMNQLSGDWAVDREEHLFRSEKKEEDLTGDWADHETDAERNL